MEQNRKATTEEMNRMQMQMRIDERMRSKVAAATSKQARHYADDYSADALVYRVIYSTCRANYRKGYSTAREDILYTMMTDAAVCFARKSCDTSNMIGDLYSAVWCYLLETIPGIQPDTTIICSGYEFIRGVDYRAMMQVCNRAIRYELSDRGGRHGSKVIIPVDYDDPAIQAIIDDGNDGARYDNYHNVTTAIDIDLFISSDRWDSKDRAIIRGLLNGLSYRDIATNMHVSAMAVCKRVKAIRARITSADIGIIRDYIG